MPGAGKDLVERLPEAERAIADGNIGRDLQATPLHIAVERPRSQDGPQVCGLRGAVLDIRSTLRGSLRVARRSRG